MLSSPLPTSLLSYSLDDLVTAGHATPMDRAVYLHRFTEETDWYNEVVLTALLPGWAWEPFPRPVRAWLRNYISGNILYLASCSLWCFYIYYFKRNVYVPEDEIPSNRAMFLQVKYAIKGLPWFCALPTLSEYMVERGWTRCYSSISEVGWPMHFAYLMIYLAICEFTIYWVHRELHDIKPLYKHLHATHHIYNKQNTLSPFAGLASEPLDGLLSAAPHVMCLFLIPTHFVTHVALIFIETLWTTNIHDCIHGDIWPIMGAGYHIIHHTTYRHNYGHYTILMDWMFGTLRYPEEEANKAR